LRKIFTLPEGIELKLIGRKWLRVKSLTEKRLELKSAKKVEPRAYNFYPKGL
jgi:hypothetical protein